MVCLGDCICSNFHALQIIVHVSSCMYKQICIGQMFTIFVMSLSGGTYITDFHRHRDGRVSSVLWVYLCTKV
jgi:hypothetical protein